MIVYQFKPSINKSPNHTRLRRIVLIRTLDIQQTTTAKPIMLRMMLLFSSFEILPLILV